uniref:Uncharacterized protein n=1 Tax=Urocitellus parryii TaxID=9999 RepID=A0A8D2HEE6_UROPR
MAVPAALIPPTQLVPPQPPISTSASSSGTTTSTSSATSSPAPSIGPSVSSGPTLFRPEPIASSAAAAAAATVTSPGGGGGSGGGSGGNGGGGGGGGGGGKEDGAFLGATAPSRRASASGNLSPSCCRSVRSQGPGFHRKPLGTSRGRGEVVTLPRRVFGARRHSPGERPVRRPREWVGSRRGHFEVR